MLALIVAKGQDTGSTTQRDVTLTCNPAHFRVPLPALSLMIARTPSYPSPHWHLIGTAHARSEIATGLSPCPPVYCFRRLPVLSFISIPSCRVIAVVRKANPGRLGTSALHRGFQGASQTRQCLHINPSGPRTNNLSLTVISQVSPMPRPPRPEGRPKGQSHMVSVFLHGATMLPRHLHGITVVWSLLPPALGHCQSGAASPIVALAMPRDSAGTVHHGGLAPERQHSVCFMIFDPGDLKNQTFDPWYNSTASLTPLGVCGHIGQENVPQR